MKMLPQAAPDTRQLLETARVVFAKASDPNTPLTVAGLALAAGLTEEAVIEVLNSPQYLEAMTREFRTMAGLTLRRGLTRLGDLVNGSLDGKDAHPKDQITAYRAILETYKVFATVRDPQNEEERLRSFTEKLQTLASIKQANVVKHASSRRASDRPHPAQEAGDR